MEKKEVIMPSAGTAPALRAVQRLPDAVAAKAAHQARELEREGGSAFCCQVAGANGRPLLAAWR